MSQEGEPKQVKKTNILVKNQFGDLFVDTKKPDLLLVPSFKALNESAPEVTSGFPVDHFKCYKVKITEGKPEFVPLTVPVKDQFEDKDFEVKKPTRLCNPVGKKVDGVLTEVNNPDGHLMCYKVKPAEGQPKHVKIIGEIHVNNQFGSLRLDTKEEKELCMPSEKLLE